MFFRKFVIIIPHTPFFLIFFNTRCLQVVVEILVNEEKEPSKRPVEYFVESKYEVNKFHYLGLERVRVDGIPVKVTFLHNGDQIPEIHHFSHILSNFYDNYRSWNTESFRYPTSNREIYFSRHAINDSISICPREKENRPTFSFNGSSSSFSSSFFFFHREKPSLCLFRLKLS